MKISEWLETIKYTKLKEQLKKEYHYDKTRDIEVDSLSKAVFAGFPINNENLKIFLALKNLEECTQKQN